jgi:hypothetical protein
LLYPTGSPKVVNATITTVPESRLQQPAISGHHDARAPVRDATASNRVAHDDERRRESEHRHGCKHRAIRTAQKPSAHLSKG